MKELTIATYNICHGHYAGLDWSRIAAVISQAEADVVGFQEMDMGTRRVGGSDTVTALCRAIGFSHALFIPAMDYDGGQYGTAILSRYPLVESGVQPLPSGGYEPRAFGFVTVKTDSGQPVTIMNTHLSVESREQQHIQFKALAEWMKAHLPPDTPSVLMGDFNTEEASAFAPVQALGYDLVNGTSHEFKTFRHPPLAIDNIVYRAGVMTPTSCGMVDSDASDHNLLWCRFSLH